MPGYGTSPLELLASQAMLAGVIYCDDFTYSAAWIAGTASALPATGTVEVQVQINSDSDFISSELNLVAFSAGAIIANPNYLLTIVRAGSGRDVSNQPQHVLTMCGSYQADRVAGARPVPMLVQANNVITCRLQNLTATVPDRVDLSFRGFKVFYTVNSEGQQGSRQSVFHVL